jgi:hypothetical protein
MRALSWILENYVMRMIVGTGFADIDVSSSCLKIALHLQLYILFVNTILLDILVRTLNFTGI